MSDKERKKNAISPDRGLPLATPDGLVQYQDFETPLGRKAQAVDIYPDARAVGLIAG